MDWLWDFDLGLSDQAEQVLPVLLLANAVATVASIWFFQWFQRRVMQPAIGAWAAESAAPGAASAHEVRAHAAVLARLESRIGELEGLQRAASRSPVNTVYKPTTPIGYAPRDDGLATSPGGLRYSASGY